MNWYGSYSRRFVIESVHPKTWDDSAVIGRVESLDVAWDADSDSIQDGSMKVVSDEPDGWLRIYLEADGDGEQVRVPIATMKATTSERAIEGDEYVASVDMDSVLFDASTAELPIGFFCPKGADPVRFVSMMLRDRCASPVEISTSDLRTDHTIVAEQGDTAVTFAKAVLEGTGRRVTVDGYGHVKVSEDIDIKSLSASQVYADGVTDKTTDGVRTVSYTRPYDPEITEGSRVSLFFPAQGIAGIFRVKSQRLADDCTVQEVVEHGVA